MTQTAPRPTLDPEQIPEGLRERHRHEAMAVLNALETALMERAEAHGGAVGADEIRLLSETLRKQPDLFGTAFDAVAHEFHSLGQRREFAAIRQDNFGRLLVSRFAHLLEGRDFGSLENGALSRGLLQPFFKAIRMMVGAESLDSMQKQIDQLVQELDSDRERTDDPNFWLELAEAPETKEQITVLFVTMASRFEEYPRRKKWFIDLINDNMPHPRPSLNGVPWEFGDRHFIYLMTALFRDIRTLVLDDAGSADLAEKVGGETVHVLRDIFAQLDRDIAQLSIADAQDTMDLVDEG